MMVVAGELLECGVPFQAKGSDEDLLEPCWHELQVSAAKRGLRSIAQDLDQHRWRRSGVESCEGSRSPGRATGCRARLSARRAPLIARSESRCVAVQRSGFL